MDAVNNFIGAIEEEKVRGIEAHNIFPKAEQLSGSVINQLLFGYMYVGEERLAEYHRLKQLLDRLMAIWNRPTTQLLFSLPWMRHCPVGPFAGAFADYNRAFANIFAHFEELIKRRMDQRASLALGHEELEY
jgi:predicted RNA-binding protein with EMAP domain